MMLAPTLTAAAALRHLDARDRATGNADVYGAQSRANMLGADSWARWWERKAREHESDARSILPPADGYQECGPAFVGDAR